MVGRVSFHGRFQQMTSRIQRVRERYEETLEQASTGNRVNTPYQDPGAYRRVHEGKGQLAQLEDYKKALTEAVDEMQFADSILSSASTALIRARELAVSGASAGHSDSDMESMAEEVASLKEEILHVGNSTYRDRYLFAGTTTDQTAYDASGVYTGNNGVRRLVAGDNSTFAVSMTGDEIFGTASGGVDIMSRLDSLEQALRNHDSTAVQGLLTDLDEGIDQVNRARVKFGARVNQATDLSEIYDEQMTALTDTISEEGEADMVSAYSQLMNLDTALQAVLQVASISTRRSLMDYL